MSGREINILPFLDPTSEIFDLKPLGILEFMTRDKKLLEILHRHNIRSIRFSKDSTFEENVAIVSRIIFNSDDLSYITSKEHPTNSEIELICYFILFTFVSWKQNFNGTIGEMVFMMDVMLYAATISNTPIPAKAFLYMLRMYHMRNIYFDKLESVLPLIQSFCLQVNPLPASIFSVFPFIIGAMEYPESNIDSDAFLAVAKEILEQKVDALSKGEAEKLAGELSLFMPGMNMSAITLFQYLIPKLEIETTAKIVISMSASIAGKVLDYGSIIPIVREPNETRSYSAPNGVMNVAMTCINTETFLNGLNIDTDMSSPDHVDIDSLIDPWTYDHITTMIEIIGSSLDACIAYLETLLKYAEAQASCDSVMNLYAMILVSYRLLCDKFETMPKIGLKLYNNVLFDHRIVCRGNLTETRNLNALRSAAYDVFILEGVETVCAVANDAVSYPFFFGEFIQRCSINADDLSILIFKGSAFITILGTALLYMQKLRVDGNTEIDEVRGATIAFIVHGLSNQSIADILFTDVRFVQVFLSMALESAMTDVVLAQLSRYFMNVKAEQNRALNTTLMAIFDGIEESFPEKGAVEFAAKVLQMMNEVMAMKGRITRTSFSQMCDSIIQKVSRLDSSELCGMFLLEAMTFLTETSSFFTLQREHLEILLYGIRTVFNDKMETLLWSKLVFLMSGERLSTSNPSFCIRCDFASRLFLQVFESTERRIESINYIQGLCDFSAKNRISCHKGEVDLYLIERIRMGDSDTCIFELLTSITGYISSSCVVERFMTLLAPVDGRLSPCFDTILKTLVNLVSQDMKEPHTMTPMVGESQITIPQSVHVTSGFTLCFWVYLETTSQRYYPVIASGRGQNDRYFHIFVAGSVLQFSMDEDPRRKSFSSNIKLPAREWIFIAVTYRVHGDYTYIITSVNNSQDEIIEKKSKKFCYGELDLVFGGVLKGSDDPESPSFLGQLGLFGILNEGGVCNLWTKGPNGLAGERDAVFSYSPRDKYEHRIASLSRVLAMQCKIPIIFPLFTMVDYSDQCSVSIVDALFEILSMLLASDTEVEKDFCNENGCIILSHILSEIGHTSYLIYSKFAGILQMIETEELRIHLLRDILINLELWIKAPIEDIIAILKHWLRVLFPSFAVLISNMCSFSTLVDKMIMYFTPANENEYFAAARSTICKVCQLVASVSFSFEDYALLISYTVARGNSRVSHDIVRLLQMLAYMEPSPLLSVSNRPEFLPFLFKLLEIPEIATIGVDILFQVCQICELPVKLDDIGAVCMSFMKDEVFNQEMFEVLIDKVQMMPSILPLSCMCALNLGKEFVVRMFEFMQLSDSTAWGVSWSLWPIIVATESDKLGRLWITSFICRADPENIMFAYSMVAIVEEATGRDLTEFRLELLTTFADLLLNGTLESVYLTQFSKLAQLLIFFQRSPRKLNPVLTRLFAETFEVEGENEVQKEISEFDCHMDAVCSVIENLEMPEVRYVFGLRFGKDGEWIDSSLAVKCVSLFRKFNVYFALHFELLMYIFLVANHREHVLLCLDQIDIPSTLRESALPYLRLLSRKLSSLGIEHPIAVKFSGREEEEIIYHFMKSLKPVIKYGHIVVLEETKKWFANANEVVSQLKQELESSSEMDIWMISQKETISNNASMRVIGESYWKRIKRCLCLPHAPFSSFTKDKSVLQRSNMTNAWRCPAQLKCDRAPISFEWDLNLKPFQCTEDKNAMLTKPCQLITVNGITNATLCLYSTSIKLLYDEYNHTQITYKEIITIRPVKVSGNDTALEICTKSGKCKLLNFASHKLQKSMYQIIQINITSECLVAERLDPNVCVKWRNHEISSFEFIIYLNVVFSRTFSYPQQYPIFPMKCVEKRAVKFSSVKQYGPYNNISVTEAIPEYFYMGELFDIDDPHGFVYRNRKMLESEATDSWLHEWIEANFGLVLDPRKPPPELPKDIISIDTHITQAMLWDYQPDGIIRAMSDTGIITDIHLVTDDLEPPQTVQVDIETPTKVVSVSNRHLVAKSGQLILDISCGDGSIREIPGTGEIYGSGDGLLSIIRPGSVIDIFEEPNFDKPFASIPFYSNPVKCCYMSKIFRVMIIGCKGCCLILPLKNGFKQSSMLTIELNEFDPEHILVSDSLGYIVTYATAVRQGKRVYKLFVHTINGSLVKDHDLAFPVGVMTSWADASLIDHIALSYQGGRNVYTGEIFDMQLNRLDQRLMGTVASLSYDRKLKKLIIVTKSATVYAVPT